MGERSRVKGDDERIIILGLIYYYFAFGIYKWFISSSNKLYWYIAYSKDSTYICHLNIKVALKYNIPYHYIFYICYSFSSDRISVIFYF